MGGLATPESSEPTRLPLRGLLYLAVLTLTWGANWPFIKMAVEDMPVLVFRAGCALTVGVVVLAFAWLSGTSLRVPRQNWRSLVLAGLFNVTLWFYYGAYILSLTGRFAGCRGPVLVAMRSPKSGFSGHGPLCYVRTD